MSVSPEQLQALAMRLQQMEAQLAVARQQQAAMAERGRVAEANLLRTEQAVGAQLGAGTTQAALGGVHAPPDGGR
eukprot:6336214-Alexandrium_andersonii.AAC.1